MQVYSDFNRLCLKDIQKQVKRVYPTLDMRKALGARQWRRGHWHVQGHLPGSLLDWHGRAEDANHAKYQAWRAHLAKIGKTETTH